MADISDVVKEEFTQSYLMYRWLDDTRGKLVDRFFILTVALFAARLQFGNYLTEKWGWLLVIYIFYALVAVSFAHCIIQFRRQQRGHNNYIKSLRIAAASYVTKIPPPNEFNGIEQNSAKKYESFISGRRVYLTKSVEFAVALIASATPLLLLDALREIENICPLFSWSTIIISVMMVAVLAYFLFLPWKRYNFNDEISWEKD